MAAIFLLLTFYACYKIAFSHGVKSAVWFLGSLLFISDTIGIWGPFNTHFLFVIAYIVSLFRDNEFKSSYEIYPLKYITIIILVIYLIIGLTDERISMISRISRPITEFGHSYVAFFVGFCMVRSYHDFEVIKKKVAIMLTIVAIYGIITFILQNNPLYDAVSMAFGGEEGIWSAVQARGYRVCSFLSNPIVYGGVMGFYSLIVLNYFFDNNKRIKHGLLALLILSVLIANSRTGMFTTAGAYIIFFLLKNKISYKNIIVFTICVLAIMGLYNFEFAKPMIDSAIDIVLTGGENTSGSTVDLKEQQWIASLYYFYDAPYFGNGFAYFGEVIGNRNSPLQDTMLAGMEGYQYKLLIENGIFLIIAVIIFYIQLVYLFFTKSNKVMGYLGIAGTISFLSFICMTGTYGSTFLHFGTYIGIILRCAYDKTILSPSTSVQR